MAVYVCPWWFGYALLNPFRYLTQNPTKILTGLLKEGQTVLEVGPGMGFFTLPMARMVGNTGKIICVDVQEQMLRRLKKRATKAGLADRIETHICTRESLGIDDLTEGVDFVLAFYMIHEVPDRKNLVAQLCRSLKPGGLLLVSEPKHHVSAAMYTETTAMILEQGVKEIDRPDIKSSFSSLFQKG